MRADSTARPADGTARRAQGGGIQLGAIGLALIVIGLLLAVDGFRSHRYPPPPAPPASAAGGSGAVGLTREASPVPSPGRTAPSQPGGRIQGGRARLGGRIQGAPAQPGGPMLPGAPSQPGGPIQGTTAQPGGPIQGPPAQPGGPVQGPPAQPGGPVQGTPAQPGGPIQGTPAQPGGPIQGPPAQPGGPMLPGAPAQPGGPMLSAPPPSDGVSRSADELVLPGAPMLPAPMLPAPMLPAPMLPAPMLPAPMLAAPMLPAEAAGAVRSDPPAGPALPYARPMLLTVPAIGVRAPTIPLGAGRGGSARVPPLSEPFLVSWFDEGPAPGQRGTADLFGHVDSRFSGPAVFYKLGLLRPGDLVGVTRADHREALFAVYSVRMFRKARFPAARIYASTGRAELRLVTCGGPFDARTHDYLDDTVAFARLTTVRTT